MITEAAVLAALAQKFAPPEYAFIQHVRNGTGYSRRTTRTADALAFSLWPSRGLELHGFEVKVSRQDWLREKDDPAKAEDIARFCDRWWLAAGDASIVQPGELPATWGLLVPGKDGSLRVATEAAKLDALPLDRLMLAAILRKVSEHMVPKDAVNELAHEAAQREIEAHKATFDGGRERKRLADELDSIKKMVAEFEEHSGVKLWPWDAGKIGGAVRVVVSAQNSTSSAAQAIEHAESTLKAELKSLSRLRSEIKLGGDT